MFWDKGVLFFLCLVIFFLLRQQSIQRTVLTKREQNEKLIQLLQAYPVHQYTMTHMLERSLAMIFSTPQLNLMPKGAVFLMDEGNLGFSAQRGLTDLLEIDSQQTFFNACLGGMNVDIDRFQYISNLQVKHIQSEQGHGVHGAYIVPLIKHNVQIGLFVFFTSEKYKTSQNEIKFIKSLGMVFSTLIARKQVAEQLNLANSVLNLSQQAIYISDKQNKIIRCNVACEQITGYSSKELIGQSPSIFNSLLHDSAFYQQIWLHVLDKGFWQGEIWNKRKNHSVFPQWLTISAIKDADDQLVQYLAIFTDLSSIKKAEKDIQTLSFYDSTTQLPNRVLFNDMVEQSIIQADLQNSQFVIFCLDIDHFKKVNESLGHSEGDKLLQVFAERIAPILAEGDSLARIGGDEFAIIIYEQNGINNSQITRIAENILENLKQPVQLLTHDVIVTASIGISCYPHDANNALDLVKYADIAMFQVKQAGRNNYQFYTEKINQQTLRKISLESALRLALKTNDFEVYFQPQKALDSQLVSGAEALLRVKRGELSHLSPAEFIPIAEETGLIIDIGDWVFAEVCRVLRSWYDNKIIPSGFKRVAINISPVQFKRPDFVQKIQQCIKETKVPVQFLEIEITESSLKESNNSVIEKLLAIKKLGITIAIDDFGTGHSSLSRLKQFPIDMLKIDRSFISDICENDSDMAIVKAIINMSNALNIGVLAEGIETVEQALLLKELHCHYGQGFLFKKPVGVGEFEIFMLSNQLEHKIAV